VSMSGNKGRLTGVTKELKLQWEDTKTYWKDARSQEFERRYIQDLLIHVDRAVTVIEKLDELVRKVRSDCE